MALSAGACKRTPKCHGDLSRDDVLERQKELADGKDTCAELARPKIVVDANGLQLAGTVLVPSAILPGGPAATPQPIQPLADALKRDRETWKQIHPGKDFDATVEVSMTPDTDAITAISVLRTLAAVGYTRCEVHAGDVVFSTELWAPLRSDSADEMAFAAVGGGEWDATHANVTKRVADAAAARALMASECTPASCDVVRVTVASRKFRDVAAFAAEVVAAPPTPAGHPRKLVL